VVHPAVPVAVQAEGRSDERHPYFQKHPILKQSRVFLFQIPSYISAGNPLF
jgi:hypothetical protein